MTKSYDKTLTRLIGILSKLSNDERYDTKEFASEYNVGVRTIQKDINERLISFPIVKDTNGKFMFIEGFSLNKSLLNNDEMMLVSLALSQFNDVSDFDKYTNSTLKKLLNPTVFNPYYIKQEDIEDISIDSSHINRLEDAIQYQNHLEIDNIKVEPYKIVAYDGIWYLVAKDTTDNKTKAYLLSKIKSTKILNSKHKTSQKDIEQILAKTNSAYFEDGICFEVKVKVYKEVAHFFEKKDFLQSQKILETYSDGSLLVSFDVSSDEDIDNIIKSWLPHIEVVEPQRYRDKIIEELEDYLVKIRD
jgi:predicted DNA-binding transcriptional regulator YafY